MPNQCEQARNVNILETVLVLLDFMIIYFYRINSNATT